MPCVVRVLTLLAALTFGHAARGDDCVSKDIGGTPLSSCFDADGLWLRPGPSDHHALGSTLTTPKGQVSMGFFVGILGQPVVLGAASPSLQGREIYVVDHALVSTLMGSVGVTDDFEVTLAIPATIYQDGAGLSPFTGDQSTFSRSNIRDPRIGFAWAFLPVPRNAETDGFSLVGRFEFAAPLGDAEAFAGASTGVAVPALTAAYRIDRVAISAEAGARIRGEVELADALLGSEMTGALGVSVNVYDPLGIRASGEIFTRASLVEQRGPEPIVPTEWLVSAAIAPFLGGDVDFSVAGGSAIPFTDSVTAPQYRFLGGVRYAPRGRDTDGDRVLDRDDLCPDAREDRDGFQDEDGCPDPDNDRDRILDTVDRCRDAAETVDGFQDEDGCPDLDDDGDEIPDEEDGCRNEREDRDGFEDEDGCLDPDNDGDKIPDGLDKCKNAAEDIDGYQDEDGCPDPDNDLDGVPDAKDECPSTREDEDGFKDGDGCPDIDNDDDGVPDARDKCKSEPETLNGKDDDDGCPEPGATSLVRWSAKRIEFVGAASFVKGTKRPTPELTSKVALAARLIRGRLASIEDGVVIVEAFADRAGDASDKAQDLAAARAEVVRDLLVEAGVAKERITAAAGDTGASRPNENVQTEITVSAVR